MSSLASTLALARPHGPARSHAVETSRRVGMLAVMALVLVAPFEVALFTIADSFVVTSVEAAMAVAIGLGGYAMSVSRAPIAWPRPLLLPGAVWLVVLTLAAWMAPVEQGRAFRFVARMAMATAMCLLFVNVIDNLQRARMLVRGLVAVATLVAAIAVLEAAQVQGVLSGLTVFRPGFHVVGGQLRATSTLFYPTITSMYLEIAFALGLWLLLEPVSRELKGRARVERGLAFAALTIIGAGISATFTRAGLVGMAAALALVAGARLTRLPRAQAALGTIARLAAVLTAIVFLSHSPQLLATRLSTEGTQAWYGARYEVPESLRLNTGRTHRIPIAITNTGRLTWDSEREPAFAMSYHWLRAGSDAVIQFDGDRTPFSSPVVPGARVTLPVFVTAPGEAGTYTLVWDVVHETRAWLSTEGVDSPRTEVRVEGAKSGAVVTKMDRLPRASIRPSRPALWSAALGIVADRPWLGVGPDNYRYVYGRYLGLERPDERVHANSMYLELLTGAGIVGLAALLWLVTAWGLALWRRCRSVPIERLMPAVAALAAWLMFVGHGLVDSFLSFTTTYLTLAMVAGLAFSRGLTTEVPDAHRV